MQRSVVVLAASAAVLALAAPPSQAVHHRHDDALPNVDRRAAERAEVPAATRAARRALGDRLGGSATVRTDPVGGGVAWVGRSDGLLSGPSQRSPREIVLDWVRDRPEVFGLAGADVAKLELVARSVSPDGITHLRFNQVLDGILAFDSGIDGHVTADGRLVNVSGAPVPGASLDGPAAPSLTAADGLRAARRAVGGDAALPRVAARAGGAARETTFAGGERAVLRWSATADGPRLAWNVLADDGDGHVYDVLLDAADGELLRRQSLTHSLGAARFFPADPDATPVQTQVTMPPAWYDEHAGGTRLWGRYARTYADPLDEDPAAGAEAGGGRRQVPASGGGAAPDWLYGPPTTFPGLTPCPATGCTWNGADLATATTNERQTAVNAHVLTSRFHDHLAQAPIGFDEASGNFQRDNASGQGRGGDYVRTEVNDGYLKTTGTPPVAAPTFNNANFSTPPDGEAPRMQMFLWLPGARHANGSDVASVVYHEYGHGLSNRLVVNASGASSLTGLQSLMMGEAWSDFYALDLLVHEGALSDTAATGELTVGSYLLGGTGVRAKPIDCPVAPAGLAGCDGHFGSGTVRGGYTYADIAVTDNSTPHSGSEVWGQLLWEIRTALGRDTALGLVTGGMRLSPDRPSMLDMRDAILQQAVATRSAPGAPDDHYERLWALFAARGFGSGASTAGADSTTPAESYEAQPSGLKAVGELAYADPYPGGDNDGLVEPGERIELSQRVWGTSLLDLPGVTGTLSAADPLLQIVDGAAAWPLLGRGRVAANGDALAVRVAPGACQRRLPLSLAISSSQGPASAAVSLDPRTFADAVVPLADGTVNPGGGADVPGVTTTSFTAGGDGAVTDVDVRIDELRHSYLGDLTVELLHDGVTVVLLDRPGGTGYGGRDILDAVIDSDAATAVATPAGGPIAGRFSPPVRAALEAFDGRPVAGAWTLRITDHAALDAGTLRRWGIDAPGQACGRVEIPAAQTGGATQLSASAATLDGSVTPNGRATGLRFAWGTTAAYGQTTAVEPAGDGDGAVLRSATLSGLAPAATYHYRVEAIRENGQVALAGEDRTFTTPPALVGDPGPGTGGGGGGDGARPGDGGRGGDGGPVPDTRGPRLSRGRASLAKVPKRRDRRRATIAFTLDEPATATVAVTRSAPGIRRGGRCVAVPRRRPRGAKPCTRRLTAARATARIAQGGAASVKLPAAGLPKGAYVATVTARDAAGNRSNALVVRFTVR